MRIRLTPKSVTLDDLDLL